MTLSYISVSYEPCFHLSGLLSDWIFPLKVDYLLPLGNRIRKRDCFPRSLPAGNGGRTVETTLQKKRDG